MGARVLGLVAGVAAGWFFAVSALAAEPVQLASLNPSAAAHATIDAQSASQLAPYARHLVQLINDYRANKGLGPLELVADLSALASEHALQMAEQRRLSHDGFRNRFDRTRARVCVENVGMNFPHAESQLDGWRASPGHHRNLLEPKVARVGIAKSEGFVTFFACS